MAGKTGRDLYAHWVQAGGTFVVASGTSEHYRSFNPGVELEMVEITAGAAGLRNYKSTLNVAEPELTIIMRDEGTFLTDKFKVGMEGSLVWGMEGSAAGRPKGGIVCQVTAFEVEATYDGELEATVTFMPISGSWLFDPETAVWP